MYGVSDISKQYIRQCYQMTKTRSGAGLQVEETYNNLILTKLKL